MKNSKKKSKSNKRSKNKTQQYRWWYVIIGLLLVIFIILWLSRTIENRKHQSTDNTQQTITQKPKSIQRSKNVAKSESGSTLIQDTTPKDSIYLNIGLPKIESRQFYFTNSSGRYCFMYDTMMRQAAWVAHILTAKEVSQKGAERGDRFRSDPMIVAKGYPTATDSDYKKSGYDRGHLLPSADRDDTSSENDATFLLSNISPQKPNLNRQIWKYLEEYVRRVAERFDSVWVVTGSKFEKDFERIGKNGVGVPRYFYKTLLIKHSGKYSAIGFYIPNDNKFDGDFQHYAKSIDQLEEIMNMDFYTGLDDSVEHNAESRFNSKLWFDKKLKR
jgi:endonuclease G